MLLLQYFNYIVEVSFIGGGNRSAQGKKPTDLPQFTVKLYQIMFCIEYSSPWAGFEFTTAPKWSWYEDVQYYMYVRLVICDLFHHLLYVDSIKIKFPCVYLGVYYSPVCYSSLKGGVELTILVLIDTDYIGKSNYHTATRAS